MQRNNKLILSIIALAVSSLFAFAQEETEYKDVFLDGKPAKLNVATGEIKLVNPEVEKITKPEETYEQPKSSSAYIVNSSDFHVVKENETLFDISKQYGVSLNRLMLTNNLESTLVDKGQTLRVNNFDVVEENTTETISESNSNSDSYSENSATTSTNFHIVKKGETLFSLSKQYGLTVNELKRLNNLNSNLIREYQKLRVNRSASEDYNASNVWVVKSGDNLYRIALNNGTTVATIKRLNGLTSNLITVGQRLQLR